MVLVLTEQLVTTHVFALEEAIFGGRTHIVKQKECIQLYCKLTHGKCVCTISFESATYRELSLAML
jgi:hypothetical protein